MGAFFLYHKDEIISKNRLETLYNNKGFGIPNCFNLGDYRLQLYQKQLLNIDNFFKIETQFIFCCGSMFYKGLNYKDSLQELLVDYNENKIDKNALFGNYILIFHEENNSKTTIVFDPAFMKQIYFHLHKKIISTDFLALKFGLDYNYSLNKIAIAENLTSGHLISPETYFNEINLVDKINFKNLSNQFENIIFNTYAPEFDIELKNREEAIEHANNQLNYYFTKASEICNNFGTHIGLTGGFDSRLLFLHAKEHIRNIIANSFWREASKEYNIAKVLAQKSNIDFFSFETRKFIEPDIDEMLKKAFYFFDGQNRSQNRWDEVFNMPEYSAEIAQTKYVGLHGCGGEQYRNADRLWGTISLKSYILYQWMYKQCKNSFLDSKFEIEVFNNIRNKILRYFPDINNTINLLQLKKIQNEIYNKANRVTRVNVLNQQQFYFAPFTEYQISHSAYFYIPFLGKSVNFQIEMIRRSDPNLANIQTTYGYNINNEESFSKQLYPYILKVLHPSVLNKLFHKTKKFNTTNERSAVKTNFEPVTQLFKNEIDFSIIKSNRNVSPVMLGFNYFLEKTL